MKRLWFKRRYVNAILSGEKTDTIRLKKPNVRPGDRVRFSVGPKPAFAEAVIENVREIMRDEIDPERKARLGVLYEEDALFEEAPKAYWLVEFSIADVLE